MVTRSGVKLCYKYNLGAEIISSQTQYQEHLGGEKKAYMVHENTHKRYVSKGKQTYKCIGYVKIQVEVMFIRLDKHTLFWLHLSLVFRGVRCKELTRLLVRS